MKVTNYNADMLRLYNSLSRSVEDFKPIDPPNVRMYTCGPTVYLFAHIGNFRAYATADILVRTLQYNKYVIDFAMNITDVGHLTSDADSGEDKLEKSAKKEGKSVWEIAQFYTTVFLADYKSLNFTAPSVLAKATDHIAEQIALVKRLEDKGFTYEIADGIYFDTAKFADYGKLSDLDDIKEGARVEANMQKRNPRDFALWKFSYPKTFSNSSLSEGEQASFPDKGGRGKVRQMEWDSPWGVGFPGWHIECSAMSMKYLGETFDIHTGGVDHKEIHHPNEIAQSEAATGKKFVNYWVHTAFMQVAGQKMSKSLGNIYRLYDLEKDGYDPMALRYLYLQTHYRKDLNFTFAALDGAQTAWRKLVSEIVKWETSEAGSKKQETDKTQNISEDSVETIEQKFLDAINDDMNMPQALAVAWELVKSDNPPSAKAKLLFQFDEVLGLRLREKSQELKNKQGIVPEHIKKLIKERNELRSQRRFSAADQIRKKIEDLGYEIEDTKKGTKLRKM